MPTDPLPAPPTNSYDEVPYDSHPYVQTHPSRLAVVASLFGLSPPQVTACRVLELGAASGGNVIPMAESLPGASVVGIDYSARQVADGERLIRKLGITNVSLRHASITDVDETYGKFDYIVCHGVFSWVPTAVREKILDVCSKNLAPGGVAYVSYNTYPGWHMRGMIRDMMRYHAMRFATPKQRVQQARALLDFLAQSVRQEGPYHSLLKTELEAVRHQNDQYLYHEHLEEVNDPLYFHQFVEMARTHGLRYLGESRVTTMVTGNFGPDVEKALRLLASDQIQTEQYLDFLRNRTFRESLLVAADNAPNWTIDPGRARFMHIASGSKPAGTTPPDIRSDATVQYETRSGMALTTNRPLLKASMQILADRWPGTIPFDELRTAARALVGTAGDPAEDTRSLAASLVNTYISSDLVELHAVPITVALAPSEKPEAMRSARVRAEEGVPGVWNARHEVIRLTDLDRRLLPLLDGTRDRAALLDRLTEVAVAGDLTVQREGQRLRDPADVRTALGAVLEQALKGMAGNALLVK
jgi:methyltransferase-like protein/SAM-dependent methyltransferase